MKIYFSLALDPRVLKDNLQSFKNYVKMSRLAGGKERWSKEFNGKYRIYLPLEQEKLPAKIANALSLIEGQILSYKDNLAKDKHGRETSISKLLQIAQKQGVDPDLLDNYTSDPLRQAEVTPENKVVVISRHPIDVAAMSTGASWTSCMTLAHKTYVPTTNSSGTTLPEGIKVDKGEYAHHISDDVREGTIVAYVVDVNDRKTIARPYCRIAIKPYYNLTDKDDVILIPESKHYGKYVPGFKETVIKWVITHFPREGVYLKNPKMYNDSVADIKIIRDKVVINWNNLSDAFTKIKEEVSKDKNVDVIYQDNDCFVLASLNDYATITIDTDTDLKTTVDEHIIKNYTPPKMKTTLMGMFIHQVDAFYLYTKKNFYHISITDNSSTMYQLNSLIPFIPKVSSTIKEKFTANSLRGCLLNYLNVYYLLTSPELVDKIVIRKALRILTDNEMLALPEIKFKEVVSDLVMANPYSYSRLKVASDAIKNRILGNVASYDREVEAFLVDDIYKEE